MLSRSVFCCVVRPSKIEGDVFLPNMGTGVCHTFLFFSTSLLHPTSFNQPGNVRQPPGLNKQRHRSSLAWEPDPRVTPPRLTAAAANYRAACVLSLFTFCVLLFWCMVFVLFVSSVSVSTLTDPYCGSYVASSIEGQLPLSLPHNLLRSVMFSSEPSHDFQEIASHLRTCLSARGATPCAPEGIPH